MDIHLAKAFRRIVLYTALVLLPIVMVDYYVDAYASFRITYNEIGRLAMDSNYCVGGDIPLSERREKWAKVNFMGKVNYMIMGSSRSMLLSQENLKLDSLYNWGVSGGSTVNDYLAETYILYVNKTLPDHMLIEISPSIFNAGSTESRWKEWGSSTEYMKDVLDGKTIHKDDSALLGVQIKDILSPAYFRYNLEQLRAHKRTYVKTTSAFSDLQLGTVHMDGSYSYSYASQTRYNEDVIRLLIRSACEAKNIYGCENFHKIDAGLCRDFCRLMEFLKDKGVQLAFYLPPYAEPMYTFICETEEFAPILEVEEWVLKYGAENNIQVYGSYDPAKSNIELTDLYDEYHIKDCKIADTLWIRNDALPNEWTK